MHDVAVPVGEDVKLAGRAIGPGNLIAVHRRLLEDRRRPVRLRRGGIKHRHLRVRQVAGAARSTASRDIR